MYFWGDRKQTAIMAAFAIFANFVALVCFFLPFLSVTFIGTWSDTGFELLEDAIDYLSFPELGSLISFSCNILGIIFSAVALKHTKALIGAIASSVVSIVFLFVHVYEDISDVAFGLILHDIMHLAVIILAIIALYINTKTIHASGANSDMFKTNESSVMCPRCNKEQEKDAVFCRFCGTPLKAVYYQSIDSVNEASPVSHKEETARSDNSAVKQEPEILASIDSEEDTVPAAHGTALVEDNTETILNLISEDIPAAKENTDSVEETSLRGYSAKETTDLVRVSGAIPVKHKIKVKAMPVSLDGGRETDIQLKEKKQELIEDKVCYTIEFREESGNIISKNNYKKGEKIGIPVMSDKTVNNINYRFEGWSPALYSHAVGAVTYTAIYRKEERDEPEEKKVVSMLPVVIGVLLLLGIVALIYFFGNGKLTTEHKDSAHVLSSEAPTLTITPTPTSVPVNTPAPVHTPKPSVFFENLSYTGSAGNNGLTAIDVNYYNGSYYYVTASGTTIKRIDALGDSSVEIWKSPGDAISQMCMIDGYIFFTHQPKSNGVYSISAIDIYGNNCFDFSFTNCFYLYYKDGWLYTTFDDDIIRFMPNSPEAYEILVPDWGRAGRVHGIDANNRIWYSYEDQLRAYAIELGTIEQVAPFELRYCDRMKVFEDTTYFTSYDVNSGTWGLYAMDLNGSYVRILNNPREFALSGEKLFYNTSKEFYCAELNGQSAIELSVAVNPTASSNNHSRMTSAGENCIAFLGEDGNIYIYNWVSGKQYLLD